MAGQFILPGPALQVTVDSDKDDLSIGGATVIDLNLDADWAITGIDGDVHGNGVFEARMVVLRNPTAFTASLPGNDPGSLAVNRFGWSGTPEIAPGEVGIIFRLAADDLWLGLTRPAPGATPAGSDGEVQYKNGAALDASSAFAFDEANSQLSITHLKIGGALSLAGDLSHTQTTGTVNDYNAGSSAGWQAASTIKINPSTGTVTLTGMEAPTGVTIDGHIKIVMNVGTGGNVINCLNDNAGSAAGNQFDAANNFAINTRETAVFQYDTLADGASGGWRLISLLTPTPHTHAGVTSGGALPDAALGSGTGSAANFLRGDRTFSALSTFVVLGSPVSNDNVVPNTMEDVTGLSFSVTSGQTYWFRAVIGYSSAATTTGSRWSVNGPTTTSLFYTSQYHSSTAGINGGGYTAYDSPAACSANSDTTTNRCIIEGLITPSANGTLIVRHASEVTLSAITALAGSWIEWRRIA